MIIHDITHEEFLESDFFHNQITIDEVTSIKILSRNLHEDVLFPAGFGMMLALPLTYHFVFNNPYTYTWGFLGLSYLAFPAIVFALEEFDGKRGKAYRAELDSLSLIAFEDFLSDDKRVNYLKSSQVTGQDEVYILRAKLNYTLRDNNEGIIRGRRDAPKLIVDWSILCPKEELVAEIRTTNRLYVTANNVVNPRSTELQDTYYKLAKHSVESFCAILLGEENNFLPSSPFYIRDKTAANITASQYIGKTPFDGVRSLLEVLGPLSRHQYLVNINQGKNVGFNEGETYSVHLPYDLNDGKWDYYHIIEYGTKYNKEQTQIGRFEAVLVDEEMTIGVIRLYKWWADTEEYVFSDEIIYGYDFRYPSPPIESTVWGSKSE